MHYNVSYSSQHQLSCSVYVIHKPKDSGLVVQCFLRKNNRSEGKEMVKRGKAMNTVLGFVPSVMIRVFFNSILMRFFYYLYFVFICSKSQV